MRERALFAGLWLLALTRLARGEPLPPLGPPARHTTLVARLPEELAQRLAAAAARLPPPAATRLYPAQTIHFTVRNLDGLADEAVEAVLATARARRAFDVTARGLGLSPQTVFVQLFPERGALPGLRRRVMVANIARFGGRAPRSLRRAVGRERRTSFGRFRVERLEFVRTDRYLSDEATIILAEITLR
jgi:hypothetical protein